MPAKKTKLKAAAQWYIKFNWFIFPCEPNGKQPLTAHGYKDASNDPAQIEEWWEKWPDANIGLACDKSEVVALDGDPSHYDDRSRELMADLSSEYLTASQSTPSNGTHLIYMAPLGVKVSNSPGSLPPGIDVRANGYILLEPSCVVYSEQEARSKGVEPGYMSFYRWLERPDETVPQPLPDRVLEALRKPEPKRTPPPNTNGYHNGNGNGVSVANGKEKYARVALDRELDALAKSSEGGRNEQLNKSAFSLGQLVASGLLDESEVGEKLENVALAIGLAEQEIRATIRSGLSSGKGQPRIVPEAPRLRFGRNHEETPPEDEEEESEDEEAPKKKAKSLVGPSKTIQLELRRMGYTFQLNELRDRIELADGSPLHDGEQATIVAQLFEQGVKNKTLILDVLLAEAWANRYDPLRDFLNSLTWDGKDYIEMLGGWFVCKNEPIQLADGSLKSVMSVWLRKWLIGAVGKALDGIQNPMLVLAGNQGIGKSEFARWLCSPLSDYFVSSPIVPDNTDHLRWLAGNFIWEVAELGATTRKADIEGLKAFLTRPECSYRVPYAKNEVHRPARASFVGTINLDNAGFLMDATGNRRFLSAELLGIQWEAYTRNIDPIQLWAQAAYLYDQDKNAWKLTPEEEEHRDEINEGYGAEDPILDALENLFTVTSEAEPDNSPFMATTQIVNLLALSVHEPTTRQLQMGVGKALRRLKVTKGRKDDIRGYWGITRRFTPRVSE
ncbi:MAG: hypothetical protein DMF06_03310 [Verrucomicrobia bacterium]|nr:MAG: hypothetical protein DMF06_03310 [Verrucomicrobiota bacterium]